MPRYAVEEFIRATQQNAEADHAFEIENPHLLEVNLNGLTWAKLGTMIGYVGNVTFERERISDQGLGKWLKKAFSGEGATMMKMEGQGRVYLAEEGKKVQILNLKQGETIYVNGNDLLAFEDRIDWDITMMRRVAGMMAGGLFNVKVTGPGMVAITTHYDPLALRVEPGQPVFTDPNATVAWSGSLSPDIQTDISFRTFLGKGSGESFQMKFEGEGWVVLQPYEEVYMQQSGS
jgi:uncharacterized protein (AIM24 family)